MQNNNFEYISTLYKEFDSLDYKGKILLFDKKFGIIPFEFPLFDIEASWFSNDLILSHLTMLYHQETSKTNFYERNFTVNLQTFTFDVRPITKWHRIFFNQHIINKFLSGRKTLNEQFNKEYNYAVDKNKFLEARLNKLGTVINWMRYTFKTIRKLL